MNTRQAVEFIRGALMGADVISRYERVEGETLADLRQNCAAALQVLRKLAAEIGNGDGRTDAQLTIIRLGLREWDKAAAGLEALWRLGG